MSDQPAILGGTPIFSPGLVFTRPAVADWEKLAPRFQAALSSGMLTKGPYLNELEQALRSYIGAPHVVCVHSCTSGLLLGIQSLGLKGQVLVPSFSFPATFHALRWNGLCIKFIDCERDTLTVNAELVREAIEADTVAVMSAYLFGNPPELQAIDALCKERGLKHFCDSAHGMGTYVDGKPAGNHCDFEVFSASPTKLLTAAEGGIVATPHEHVAQHLKVGRDYGNPGDYDCRFPGLNGRMSELHAAICLEGLPLLGHWVEQRRTIVERYQALLGELPGVSFQKIREGCRSSHKDFPVLFDPEAFGLSRDLLKKALEAEGIPSRAYFDPPGHEQTPYRVEVALPNTDWICERILCLPISSQMKLEEVDRVVEAIARIHRHAPVLAGAAV